MDDKDANLLLDIIDNWKKRSFYYHQEIDNKTGGEFTQDVVAEFCSNRKTKGVSSRSTWFKKYAKQTIERVWKRKQRQFKKNLNVYSIDNVASKTKPKDISIDLRLRLHLLLGHVIAPNVNILNSTISQQGREGVDRAIIISNGYWGRGQSSLSEDEIERLAKTLKREKKEIVYLLENTKQLLWGNRMSYLRECIVENPSIYEKKLFAGCQLFLPESLCDVYARGSMTGYELVMSRKYPDVTFAVLKIINCNSIEELRELTADIIKEAEKITHIPHKKKIISSYKNLTKYLNQNGTYKTFYKNLQTNEVIPESFFHHVAYKTKDNDYEKWSRI